MKKDNKGFTLVELLVVVAIIGILAVVAVPSLFKNIEKAKIAELEAEISAIKTASLAYYNQHGELPFGYVYDDVIGYDDSLGLELEGISDPFKSVAYLLLSNKNEYMDLMIFMGEKNKISESGLQKIFKDIPNSRLSSDEEDLIIRLIDNR